MKAKTLASLGVYKSKYFSAIPMSGWPTNRSRLYLVLFFQFFLNIRKFFLQKTVSLIGIDDVIDSKGFTFFSKTFAPLFASNREKLIP